MRWEEIGELPCSVARTLSVVGDRWTMLVIRNCFLGTRRFGDFQQQLDITKHLLTARLKKLVEHGILRKDLYQEKPARYEYRLTDKGKDLYPILMAVIAWGDKYMAGDAGPPVVYEHKVCGHEMHPILVCSECKEELPPRDVLPKIGPGLLAHQVEEQPT